MYRINEYNVNLGRYYDRHPIIHPIKHSKTDILRTKKPIRSLKPKAKIEYREKFESFYEKINLNQCRFEKFKYFDYSYKIAEKNLNFLSRYPTITHKIARNWYDIIFEKLNIKERSEKIYFLIDIMLDPDIENHIKKNFLSLMMKYIYARLDRKLFQNSADIEDFKEFCNQNLDITLEELKKPIKEPENFFIYSKFNKNTLSISDEEYNNIMEDFESRRISRKEKTTPPLELDFKIVDKTKR